VNSSGRQTDFCVVTPLLVRWLLGRLRGLPLWRKQLGPPLPDATVYDPCQIYGGTTVSPRPEFSVHCSTAKPCALLSRFCLMPAVFFFRHFDAVARGHTLRAYPLPFVRRHSRTRIGVCLISTVETLLVGSYCSPGLLFPPVRVVPLPVTCKPWRFFTIVPGGTTVARTFAAGCLKAASAIPTLFCLWVGTMPAWSLCALPHCPQSTCLNHAIPYPPSHRQSHCVLFCRPSLHCTTHSFNGLHGHYCVLCYSYYCVRAQQYYSTITFHSCMWKEDIAFVCFLAIILCQSIVLTIVPFFHLVPLGCSCVHAFSVSHSTDK